jgi:hypothetical protein
MGTRVQQGRESQGQVRRCLGPSLYIISAPWRMGSERRSFLANRIITIILFRRTFIFWGFSFAFGHSFSFLFNLKILIAFQIFFDFNHVRPAARLQCSSGSLSLLGQCRDGARLHASISSRLILKQLRAQYQPRIGSNSVQR